jgi:hypothetical protein
MLNFKEFVQASAAFLPTAWTGSESGEDADHKSPVGSVDMPMNGVEKNGTINRLEKKSNPVKIGMTDGSDISIPWDHLRAWLGRDPFSQLEIGKNITVKFDSHGENSRVSGITIR